VLSNLVLHFRELCRDHLHSLAGYDEPEILSCSISSIFPKGADVRQSPNIEITCAWFSVPYVLCMIVGIILLCIFPGIAIWLVTYLIGPTI
jgi:hypothetical protein